MLKPPPAVMVAGEKVIWILFTQRRKGLFVFALFNVAMCGEISTRRTSGYEI